MSSNPQNVDNGIVLKYKMKKFKILTVQSWKYSNNNTDQNIIIIIK